MPVLLGIAALGISGFDSWMKWREADKQGKVVTTQTLLLAAAIAGAMYFAVKAARR